MKNTPAVILIMLAVGLFYTFTDGQYKKVKDLQVLSDNYKDILENASAIIAFRDNLQVSYNTLPQTEVDRVNKSLPDNVDSIRQALDLDNLASRYGISIKSIQVDTKPNDNSNIINISDPVNSYEKATVSFGFSSSYESFKRLLADLEKNLRIMDIRSVSFESEEGNLYQFKISVDVYWLK